jgi:hypothetical protein
MNSRERILSAINHRQPDRVPVDLGATPSSGISAVAYHNLIRHSGLTHLRNHVYDVIQEVTQPEIELLDKFGVDVLDVGRFFNTPADYWQKLELMDGVPGLYPKWFNPEKQQDGSWLAPGKTGEFIGKMPVGATFFDQLIFPYIDGYPSDYNNISKEMSGLSGVGLGLLRSTELGRRISGRHSDLQFYRKEAKLTRLCSSVLDAIFSNGVHFFAELIIFLWTSIWNQRMSTDCLIN